MPPPDIAPAAELPANRWVDAHRTEAERFVESDAGWVRQGDACVGGVEALQPQQREQRRVKCPTDAAALVYSLGDNGYFELYRNTVAGLVQGDPMVRVGGPAGSAGESPGLIQTLIDGSINSSVKLDFLTYHRYGDDNGLPIADVTDAVAFHESLMNVISTTNVGGIKFTGEVLNDEFGPSYMPLIARDSEVAASYIAKVIHLIGSDPVAPPPASYGYWAVLCDVAPRLILCDVAPRLILCDVAPRLIS